MVWFAWPKKTRCGILECWKLKNYFFYYFYFSFYLFSFFIILAARNQQIWLEKQTLWLNLPYGHLGRQPLKTLGSEVTHPPWPPSVHITNQHYHLHITLLTQPTLHYKTNTTTYYIHHTHTTTFTYNNNPLHTITWSCRHTCRPHALSCRSHAGLMQAHADPMQAVMQSHVLSTPISVVCGCASITWSLIWAIFLLWPHFLTGCVDTWPDGCAF